MESKRGVMLFRSGQAGVRLRITGQELESAEPNGNALAVLGLCNRLTTVSILHFITSNLVG
jgi:hypothetical protein